MGLRRLRIALLCATCLYPATATEVRAEPISTAIGLTALIAGGLGVTAATAGIIGGVLISGAVSVGATLISRSLQSTPDSVTPQTPIGVQGQMTAGAVAARNRVHGKMAIDGKLEYWRVYGENNSHLQLVISLASGPHELFGIIDDGSPASLETLGSNFYGINGRKWSGSFHTAYVRFYNGYYDQEADPDLVAASDPANPWTVNARGRGVCYAMVELIYQPDVYPNGIPSFQFIIGARVYDRRKDSSSGGSGLHRWDDQHTWEFNDNVAVGLYEFERGLTIGSQPIIGRHLAPVDIITDYFVGSANICDEAVALKGGGTEPRYRIGMNVGADRDLVSVERDFCTAMAGEIVESIGAYGAVAGVAQAAAMTFMDADLVEKKEVRFSQKKSRSELVNAVYGAFSDPNQNYQPSPYAPRFSDDDAAADGEPFVVQRDVIMIPSETQAQRVVEHLRREARLQGTATVTLKHKFSPLEAGDWVRWISARRNFDKTFKIVRHMLNDDRTITLALKEIDAGVFGWNPATDQLDPQNPVSLPGYGAPITSVPDFDLFALQVGGSGGLIIPALQCVWSPIFDRTVDNVIIQYRVGTDDATIKTAPPADPQNGEAIITDGIQAATPYQARAIITTTPPRTVVWTDWAPITAPPQHIVPSALAADAAATVPAGGIFGQIIAAQIADAAITAAKIAAAAVTATAFAAGIEPVSVVASLPSPVGYTGMKAVFNIGDGKLYRYVDGAFTAEVPTVDLVGQIIGDQIEAGAVTGTKIADAAITAAKIAAAAVTATAFAAGIQPIAYVETLPSPVDYDGPNTVFNEADHKVYRYTGSEFTAVVPTVDLTGQITTTQITDTAITTPKVAANAITAALIAANTITAAQIAANTLTAGTIAAGAIGTTQLAANAVTATIIAAGAVTTAKLAVGAGKNRIYNSDLQAGLAGYSIYVDGVGTTPPSLVLLSSIDPAAPPPGMDGGFLYFPSGTPPANSYIYVRNASPDIAGNAYKYPVVGGKRYEFSAYLHTQNCQSWIVIRFCNAAGAILSTPTSSIVSTAGVGPLNQWNRATGFAVAPAGASFAVFSVIGFYSGAAGPQVGFTGLYFDEAFDNQTEFTPWSPSGATLIAGGQIVTDSLTATQIAASAISTSELAANAVTAAKIAANTITAAQIAANTLTAGTIAAGAISTAQLAAGGVTTAILAAGAVTTAILAAQAVTSDKVTTGQLITLQAQIANLIVGDIHIVSGSVTVADAALVGPNNGTGGWQTTNTITLTFTNTTNGYKIPINIGGSVVLHRSGGISLEADVTLNGARIWYDFETNVVDRVTYFQGGYYVTGNGGTVVATVLLNYSASSGSFLVQGGVLNASGNKK